MHRNRKPPPPEALRPAQPRCCSTNPASGRPHLPGRKEMCRMRLSTDDSVVRSGRALLGFMSEEEATAFVANQTASSWEELRPVWQEARAVYEDLPIFEPQQPKLVDLPLEVMEEVQAIRSAPAF